MNLQTVTLRCPILPLQSLLSQNPRPSSPFPLSVPPNRCQYSSVFSWCGGVDIPVPKHHPSSSSPLCFANNTGYKDESLSDDRFRAAASVKDVDVSTLGNLCVDIVLNVPELPPRDREERKVYMEQLSASPPDKRFWEAGGNCNTAIAAARLGLCCTSIGYVGDEIYGNFLLDVLQNEGIGMVGMSEETDFDCSGASYETLLCWVLVDPLQRHGFCSRADFSKEPAFSWVRKLSGEAKVAIERSKIMFCNGYGFDDLSPSLIMAAIDYAVEVKTSIFFDPGPRGKSLSRGSPEERMALEKFLKMSDVLLLTSDEAESLTGIHNPVLAGHELLRHGARTKWVVVKMGARGSIIITGSSVSYAPSFKVNVVDTVGCGDSFVAAIAFGFINNLPLVNTLTIANAVGAATATGCGAGRNVAKLDSAIGLMKAAQLHEDDKFWLTLLEDSKLDFHEITSLSKTVVNGSRSRLNCITLEKVVSELLPKLELSKVKDTVAS